MTSLLELIDGAGTLLFNEAINILIIESLFGVLGSSVVFVVYYIIKKALDAVEESSETKEDVVVLRAAKALLLVMSIISFAYMSFPSFVMATKLMVAPHVTLMEKGYKTLKGD